MQGILTRTHSDVAELGLLGVAYAGFSSIIGWLADADTVTVATSAGR